MINIKDKDGESYNGGKSYRLNVPPNAPVEQYWSVTAYDRQTHALIKNMARASRSSQIPEMTKNADGSVDIYFGPAAPAGKDASMISRSRLSHCGANATAFALSLVLYQTIFGLPKPRPQSWSSYEARRRIHDRI